MGRFSVREGHEINYFPFTRSDLHGTGLGVRRKRASSSYDIDGGNVFWVTDRRTFQKRLESVFAVLGQLGKYGNPTTFTRRSYPCPCDGQGDVKYRPGRNTRVRCPPKTINGRRRPDVFRTRWNAFFPAWTLLALVTYASGADDKRDQPNRRDHVPPDGWGGKLARSISLHEYGDEDGGRGYYRGSGVDTEERNTYDIVNTS